MALVDFNIFEYVHTARQIHGVRVQDYQRYRRYCAHRLHSVRKVAKLQQGTSTTFHKKDVTADMASKPEHVEVLVLQAERAWAYAMELREQYTRTEEPRQHQHMVRRLKASCKAARQLAGIAPGFCDRRTALAAAAYWLQLQSQLGFEAELWEAALDCATLSRVINDQLARDSGAQHYALSQAMAATLDPIIRLAAYRVRVAGAQHAQPASIAMQWYESDMKGSASRVSATIPEYNVIVCALEALAKETREAASDDAGSAAFANELQWRGGSVSFADRELASLVAKAQVLLAAAAGGDRGSTSSAEALEAAVTAFKRVDKSARRCYAESVAAASKAQSAASDALPPAYLVVQLYCVCALGAMAVAKCVGEAQEIAVQHGATFDAPMPLLGSGSAGVWIAEDLPQTSDGLHAKTGGQPTLSRLVLCYDMARTRLGALKTRVANALGKLTPEANRRVRAQQLVEEVTAAAAYYDSVRNYYSAALHASLRYRQSLDSLALLDSVVTENVPRAAALVAVAGRDVASRSESSAVDKLWGRVVSVSADDVARLGAAAEAALSDARALCTTAPHADTVQVADQQAWYRNPSTGPVLVANELASHGSKGVAAPPARVPKLVDLSEAPVAAVPVKPLFYDLAAADIDFDMAAIDERASKQGGGGLGAIIGSLWGR
ncbi:signal recognition particle subunit srp68 [Coemansia sp. RSA 988]|nr:signal recognition particle subunit srp68 [Coemansia sp. RSA 988]